MKFSLRVSADISICMYAMIHTTNKVIHLLMCLKINVAKNQMHHHPSLAGAKFPPVSHFQIQSLPQELCLHDSS